MERKNENIIITVIISITVLEIVALLMGINGILLTLVIATLSGIAGFTIPKDKIKELIKNVRK